MKLLVCAIWDDAVKAFVTPQYFRAKGEAIRAFSTAANDAKSQIHLHSYDYALFGLGEWDDNSGEYHPFKVPERFITAKECIVEDDVFTADKRLPM